MKRTVIYLAVLAVLRHEPRRVPAIFGRQYEDDASVVAWTSPLERAA